MGRPAADTLLQRKRFMYEYAHFCLIYISFFVFVEGLAFKEREKMFGKEKLFSVLGSSRANIICILINLFL